MVAFALVLCCLVVCCLVWGTGPELAWPLGCVVAGVPRLVLLPLLLVVPVFFAAAQCPPSKGALPRTVGATALPSDRLVDSLVCALLVCPVHTYRVVALFVVSCFWAARLLQVRLPRLSASYFQ